jgi:hypothetical protein
MTAGAPAQFDPWADALAAAGLLAVDPAGLGGAIIRGFPGPARDSWLGALKAALPADAPIRRAPSHIDDERLLGGLDLSATLAAGRPVAPWPDAPLAAALLARLTGTTPSAAQSAAFGATLVFYAEHEFNASTFAARTVASTGSDLHSAMR